jgi:hypothetical protein
VHRGSVLCSVAQYFQLGGSVDQLVVRWLAARQVSVLFSAHLHSAGALHAELNGRVMMKTRRPLPLTGYGM